MELDELLEFTDALAADIPELCAADAGFDAHAIVNEVAAAVDLKLLVDLATNSNADNKLTAVVEGRNSAKLATKEEKQERVREKERLKYRRKKVGLASACGHELSPR